MEPANDTLPPYPGSFGDRLRACREASNLTQKQVATYVDCHHTTISKIEDGRFDPSVDILRKLLLVYISRQPVDIGGLLFGTTPHEMRQLARERFGPHEHAVPEDV